VGLGLFRSSGVQGTILDSHSYLMSFQYPISIHYLGCTIVDPPLKKCSQVMLIIIPSRWKSRKCRNKGRQNGGWNKNSLNIAKFVVMVMYVEPLEHCREHNVEITIYSNGSLQWSWIRWTTATSLESSVNSSTCGCLFVMLQHLPYAFGIFREYLRQARRKGRERSCFTKIEHPDQKRNTNNTKELTTERSCWCLGWTVTTTKWNNERTPIQE